MKLSSNVTSSRRKCRKAYFNAPSHKRRIMMSAALSKELQEKYKVRSLPLRKDDEIQIVRGHFHNREGKVTHVFRKNFCVNVERITKEKPNGQSHMIPIRASKVVIVKPKLDKDRKALLERKAKSEK